MLQKLFQNDANLNLINYIKCSFERMTFDYRSLTNYKDLTFVLTSNHHITKEQIFVCIQQLVFVQVQLE